MSTLGSILNSGQSGMMAAKAAIATTGHNISNASTEGYSRQRIQTDAGEPNSITHIGTGVLVSRVERVNDEYLEKQIRNSKRDMTNLEEKNLAFRQIEDIFNELTGDGLNRLISRFFNEFRKLSNEPENPAVRQSVQEASKSMVNEIRRMRKEVDEVRRHLDARLEGTVVEVNSTLSELADLNTRIQVTTVNRTSPADLLDKRDFALKKLGSFFDVSSYIDDHGNITADLKGGRPLISQGKPTFLSIERTPADEFGKMDQSFDVKILRAGSAPINHVLQGGKLGAIVEMRDSVLGQVMTRLDDLAFTLTNSVNEVHRLGVTPTGKNGVNFFKVQENKSRAAEYIDLSDDIKADINNIATASVANAPGDNRTALAIAKLQNKALLNDGHATLDEFFNSIVSDVGVSNAKNQAELNQQKDIMSQLNKIREQISGVSIDEETTFLMQFQHSFDAAAKVIQVADDLLKTVLSLKRD